MLSGSLRVTLQTLTAQRSLFENEACIDCCSSPLSNVPLSEGVGGGKSQVFLSFLNAELKCSSHSFNIAQYFLIRKSHDLEAGLFQISFFLSFR